MARLFLSGLELKIDSSSVPASSSRHDDDYRLTDRREATIFDSDNLLFDETSGNNRRLLRALMSTLASGVPNELITGRPTD